GAAPRRGARAGGACGAFVRATRCKKNNRGDRLPGGKNGRACRAVRSGNCGSATAEGHGPRATGGETGHRQREVCDGAAGRCATGANGDATRADPQAQKGSSGGDDTDGGAGRSYGLRADIEEIRRHGGGDYRESQLTAEQRELNEINSSIYCFTAAKLWPALAQVKPNNKHREIYLTDAIGVLSANGETVLAEIAPDARETLGCNTRADLA